MPSGAARPGGGGVRQLCLFPELFGGRESLPAAPERARPSPEARELAEALRLVLRQAPLVLASPRLSEFERELLGRLARRAATCLAAEAGCGGGGELDLPA